MQDTNALIEKLENANDIKKTIKILKKLDLSELSPNILMKIRNIISSKDYMRYVKRLVDDGSGIIFAIISTLLIFILVTIGVGLAVASIDALMMSIVLSGVLAFITKLIIDDSLKEVQKKPSKKQKKFIEDYQKLLEELIIEPSKIKEKITSNEENTLDLTNLIIKARLIIITRCSENNKVKYNTMLDGLIETYKQNIQDIESNLQDNPDFANDYKNILFKELEKNIEQLLQEINLLQNYEQQKLETLIGSLNGILQLDDINEKLWKYIELSNKLCIEATPENVIFNTLAIETIAEYYLVLIEQNKNLNLRWFLPQLNPTYYDAILNLLFKKLDVTYKIENFDESTKLQNIESLSVAYINNKQGISTNNKLFRTI